MKISPKNTRKLWIAVGVFVLLMLCVSLAPLLAMPAIFTSTVKLVENLDPAAELASGGAGMPEQQLPPTPEPTPGVASLLLQFGQEGSGPGYFEDARSIAVDGDGRIYVAQYLGGRVQVFDAQGEFLTQWLVDAKAPLRGMAASRDGKLYIAQGGKLLVFDGSSGTQSGVISAPEIFIDDVAVALNGDLLVSSYRGRDDLVRLSPQGEVLSKIEGAISEQSGDSELDMRVAVDGLDQIYALGSFNEAVFKFTADGRYVNRFGSRGNAPGQFTSPAAIAIDQQGNVYIADMLKILIFDSDGRFIDQFEVPGGAPSGLAFDQQNNLYVVARTTVLKYQINP